MTQITLTFESVAALDAFTLEHSARLRAYDYLLTEVSAEAEAEPETVKTATKSRARARAKKETESELEPVRPTPRVVKKATPAKSSTGTRAKKNSV